MKKLPNLEAMPSDISPASNAFDVNGKPMYLLGWPGYRTSKNKSGLDYLETQAEWGHMQGLFIRWLVLGKFRTHNPFYLLGMTFIGLLYGGIPLVLILHEVFFAGNWWILLLLVGAPNIVVGLLLLINVVLTIVDWDGETITGD